MQSGSYTAIITPFKDNTVDYDGLDRLVDFQITNGITGIRNMPQGMPAFLRDFNTSSRSCGDGCSPNTS